MTITLAQNLVRLTVPNGLLRYRLGGRHKVDLEGRCRMCERVAAEWKLTRHHLVKQEWFKWREFEIFNPARKEWEEYERHRIRDVDANIVPLCVKCHISVEHDPVARSLLRKVLAPVEVAFYVAMLGQAAFDERYKPLAVAHKVS